MAANRSKKQPTKRIVVEIIIALLILVPALILCLNLRKVVLSGVFKIVELKPNSAGFDSWLNPPTTITRGYYLFNISNPIDVVTAPATTTIHLNETPSYSYLLTATKQNVQWSADKKSISYSIYRLFTRHATRFNPSSVNDTGVFVDLLRAILRTQFGLKPPPSFYALGGNELFYRRNAIKQLEGFTSDLFYAMQNQMTGPNTQQFGFIYRYNHSRNYNFTIKAGRERENEINRLI